MINGVIFDLDGVIVSTDEFHFHAWARLAREENIPFTRQINERLRGVSRRQCLNIMLENAPRTFSSVEIDEMMTRKNGYYLDQVRTLTPDRILPGVRPVLDELRQRGVKMAIGSSSRNCAMILQRIGLDHFFDAVADGTHIRHSKPHPEVFLLAAERLGIAPRDCLVVEDAEAGVGAALAAGMKVLAVGTASHDVRAHKCAPDLAALSGADLLAIS